MNCSLIFTLPVPVVLQSYIQRLIAQVGPAKHQLVKQNIGFPVEQMTPGFLAKPTPSCRYNFGSASVNRGFLVL